MKAGDLVKYNNGQDVWQGIILHIYYGSKWPLVEVYFFKQEVKKLLWATVLEVVSK